METADVNDSKHFFISGVALSDSSDRFGASVMVIAKAPQSDKIERYQIRNMSKFDHEKFLQNLANDLNANAPNNNESVNHIFKKI